MSMFESVCVGAGGGRRPERRGRTDSEQTGDPHLDTVIRCGPISKPRGTVVTRASGQWRRWPGAPEERADLVLFDS